MHVNLIGMVGGFVTQFWFDVENLQLHFKQITIRLH